PGAPRGRGPDPGVRGAPPRRPRLPKPAKRPRGRQRERSADMTYRYGQYRDGPDPLAPPYDARLALDELGDAVLGGSDPASAQRDLIRRGMRGQRGLDDMLRR